MANFVIKFTKDGNMWNKYNKDEYATVGTRFHSNPSTPDINKAYVFNDRMMRNICLTDCVKVPIGIVEL